MIRTNAINLDSNPNEWLADPRIQQHLPPEHVLAYVNLMHYAHKLTATSGSEYVDGDFSCATALKRVLHLSEDALDAMLDAELVSIVDGDRWRVDYITTQTTHRFLQDRADVYEQAEDARKANRVAQKAMQKSVDDKAQRKRDQDAERQRRLRASKAAKTCPGCEQFGQSGCSVHTTHWDNSEPEKVGAGTGGGWRNDEPPFP